MSHKEFIADLEYGHIDENRLASYILEHFASDSDCDLMRDHRFTIQDILNGRLTQDKPLQDIKDMVERWNAAAGGRLIFPEYIA